MNAAGHSLGFLRELTWGDVLLVLAVLVGGQLLVLAVRWIVRRTAESAPSHRRLVILRTAPIARLVIGIAGIANGEVKAIGTRAVHLVTADDTEVIIPHARLWSTSVFNASGGKPSLLCVTDFYLHADHDGAAVRQALAEIGETSSYRKLETKVTVVAVETPWGTHYKIKAYVTESREQFAMITDLTLRGKERLRAMRVAFAQAPYAQTATG